MNHNGKIELLDCTLRDGGYVNNWWFDRKVVREVYRSLSKAGVDYVEMGFRGNRKYSDPAVYGPWRFSLEADLQEAVKGIEGAKIAVMGDYGKVDLADFANKSDSVVEMVRIAAHKDQILNALGFLERLKTKGYTTSLQVMAYANYSEAEKAELQRAVKDSGLDYLYVADSYGSILPDEIKGLFEPFLDLERIKIGFHPHNNLQMAFANTLEAMRIGVQIFDSSIYGMGRGAGNLPTEVIVAYLEVRGNNKYNVIPVLNSVDSHFVDLKKQMPWGYQLPYMISGMFKCHPNYANDLVKRKEYTIEDIWKALEVIEEIKPVGFDRALIQRLLEREVLGSLDREALSRPTEVLEVRERAPLTPVPYISRHQGRDFLVLANGPTLKEYRGQVQEFIDRYDPVVLGANYLADLFCPHYHAFSNKKRFAMYVETVNPASQLFIGENIPEEMIEEYVKRDYETMYFRDVVDANFNIVNGRIQSNCRTVSVLLIGIALVMGAKRIFVAGMDGYINKNSVQGTLFYDEKFEPEDLELNIERHHWSDRFLHQIDRYIQERGQEGLHILTPTSYYAFYKGIENYL